MRADDSPAMHGILHQGFVAGQRVCLGSVVVEEPLDEQLGPGGGAQAIQPAEFGVGLAGGRIAGENARAVSAVPVSIRPVQDIVAIPLKTDYPPAQVRMQSVRISAVQSRVRHGNRDAGAVEPELLGDCGRADLAIIASDQLGRRLVHQPAARGLLQPQHETGLRQRLQAGRGEGAA